MACTIYNRSLELGLTKKQSLLVVAISAHETGYWVSYNFKNKNNFGGLYNGSEGTFYSYETQQEGLDTMIILLRDNYFGAGRNTIEKIGEIYCPVGAKNDPKGLNKNWVPRVSQIYNYYSGLQK